MPFATTWMDLEIIIISEVRQRQRSYDIAYCGFQKILQMNLYKKQK